MIRDVTPIAAPRTESGSTIAQELGGAAFRVAIAINRFDRELVMLAFFDKMGNC
jgi:hypothetical protein